MSSITMKVRKWFIMNATCFLAFFLASILIPSLCFTSDDVKISTNKISDKVSVYNVEGLQSTNIIVIDTEKGLVIIDSETSPVFADAIRKKIKENNKGKPIRYLINTHNHGDHTYGNQVFADATIIGHELGKEEMLKNKAKAKQTSDQISNVLKAMKMKLQNLDKNSDAAAEMTRRIAYYESVAAGLGDNFVLTTPDITFSDNMHIDLGDKTLSLMYYGFSHSLSDIVICCPEESLLVTGDLFYENNDPYFDSERIPFIRRCKGTLEKLLSDTSQIHYIVPGHGEMLPVSLLQNNLKTITEKQKEFEGKASAFFEFKKAYETNGLEASLHKMNVLKSDPGHYYFLHPEFDTYAYKLMNQGKLPEALEMFTLLAEWFSESYLAFDSLGEVYRRQGDKEKAIKYFSRSLELDPNNDNAKNMLEQLRQK